MTKKVGGGKVYPPDNEIWYTTSDGKVLEISGNFENTYTDKGVISGTYDFLSLDWYIEDDRTRLTSISLPKSINVINREVLAGCSSLKNILMDSVINIEEAAFYGCGFEDIVIPKLCTNIAEYAFGECMNLKKVQFEGEVQAIQEGVFYGCPITEIIVPSGLEEHYRTLLPDFADVIKSN